MPRIARGLAGGEIYHIINRGNRRTEVFHNSDDYEKFIDLMQEAKKMTNVKIYSWYRRCWCYCTYSSFYKIPTCKSKRDNIISWA